MKDSKKDSSATTSRAPFEPATEKSHVRLVIYEIEDLASRGKESSPECRQIVELARSVTRVLNADASALSNLPHVAS